MIRKATFSCLLIALAYALWTSAEFVEIAAGISLFMFGMLCLEEGFKYFTGGTLEAMLRLSTDRLWKSLAFGATSTTLMQSSSLVSLITVSFVSAEMISLAAGIGIIMGANVGTTSGAWLIAGLGLKIDIVAYALPVLVFGVLFRLQNARAVQACGYLLLGFAFLFLGIHYMKTGFESAQDSFDLARYAMTGLPGLLLYTAIGAAITVVMQSSHATLLIIITALAAHQISYENALALAIGANLGSTVTIVLGSFTSNLGGKRLAIFHVAFNAVTALVAIVFIAELAALVDALASVLGLAPQNYLLKLALFHTLFNTIGVLCFLPFVSPLATFLDERISFRPKGDEYPIYLLNDALETPATTVAAVKKEVEHLLENAYGLIAHGLSLSRHTISSEEPLLQAIHQTRRIFPIDVENAYEAKIKGLHGEIVSFIAKAQARETTQEAAERLYELRRASLNIVEVVKGMKHLHKNLRRHALSSNSAVRERYDQIRLQLAIMLRETRRILAEEPEDIAVLALDVIKLEQGKSSALITENLDEMIRQRRIPPAIATSIMNDADYVKGISGRLLNTVELLRKTEVSQAVETLSLSEEDIDELLANDINPQAQNRD